MKSHISFSAEICGEYSMVLSWRCKWIAIIERSKKETLVKIMIWIPSCSGHNLEFQWHDNLIYNIAAEIISHSLSYMGWRSKAHKKIERYDLTVDCLRLSGLFLSLTGCADGDSTRNNKGKLFSKQFHVCPSHENGKHILDPFRLQSDEKQIWGHIQGTVRHFSSPWIVRIFQEALRYFWTCQI